MKLGTLVGLLCVLYMGLASPVLQAELVGHWKLDEANNADPLVDSTGNSSDGTIGAVADVIPGAAGIFGTSFDFQGRSTDEAQNDGYAMTGSDDVIPASGNFSLFAWINSTSSLDQYIFSNHPGLNTTNGRFALNTTAAGTLNFFVGGTNGGSGDSGVNVVDGTWHHVGLSRNNSDANPWTFWIDGAPVQDSATATVTESVNTGSSHFWDIGNRENSSTNNDGDRTWSGRIDDVRVYDTALTPKQVTSLALVTHYRLDENPAGPVVDSIGQRPDGTNNGATVGQTPAPNTTGTSYSFDGSNDKIELNTNDLLPASTNDFSAFMWINTTQNTDSAGAYLLNNWVSGQPGRFALQISGGELGYFIEAEAFSSDIAVDDGMWHLVGLSREDGDYALWVDGMMIDVGDASAALSLTEEWYLGGRAVDNARNYAGLMDDVRIYGRALSESEVNLLMVPEPGTMTLAVCTALVWGVRRRS